MAKSTKKSTRKFEKNHLKDAIEKRKAGAKIKQRQQLKAKRQARNAKDAEFSGKGNREDGDGDGQLKKNGSKEDHFGEMNVDEFFQGGFEIPEKPKSAKKPTEKLGKRKRSEPEQEDDSSDASFDEEPVLSESEQESDAEDQAGMSKEAMDALAEKDPEFYIFQGKRPGSLRFR